MENSDVAPWHPWHNGYPISHFYRRTFSERIRNRRFRIGVFSTSFIIRNMDAAESPDSLLRELLRHQIVESEYNSGGSPEKFSVIIRSHLLEKPIQIPYGDFEQNTPDAIMNLFDSVEQSGKKRNRPSLYSQPIHLEIVMGPDSDEVLELIADRTTGRTGSGPRRNVIHNINRSALIEVPNSGVLAKNLCLFIAIAMARQYVLSGREGRRSLKAFQKLTVGRSAFYQEKRLGMALQLIKEINTHLGAGLSANLAKYSVDEHIPLIQEYFDSAHPRTYRIVLFGQLGKYKPLWRGRRRAKYELPIFLESGHFIAIRRLSAFFGVKYYCVDCEGPYDGVRRHRSKCKSRCVRCSGKGFAFSCPDDQPIGYFRKCSGCQIIFNNESCYARHLAKKLCERRKKCNECGLLYRVCGGEDHECFVKFCKQCYRKHPIKEGCFVEKIKMRELNRKREPYLLIFYDFECTTHTLAKSESFSTTRILEDSDLDEVDNYADGGQGEGYFPPPDENRPRVFEHHVNCVSAYLTCSECVRENRWLSKTTGCCAICGPDLTRMKTWVFGGEDKIADPVDTFLQWLLHGLNGGRKRRRKTYALAHYSGRYDMHLLAGAIYRLGGLAPRIIRSGNKLFELALDRRRDICPEISFRDTFNWMSMRLADLPKAMDLGAEIQDKLFFPHAYNRNENLDIIRTELPPAADYWPAMMDTKKRKQFDEWYSQNLRTPFCLREQLQIYCENDVILLAHAVIKFQLLFKSLAPSPEYEDDIVANTLTIASACIRHFCINHLLPRQVAIVPDLGYHRRDVQSFKGLKFLRWYAHHHQVSVQHRDSGAEGEHRLFIPQTGETFKLDGFVRRQPFEKDLCIEFNGCAWHGHDCVYEPDEICLNGKTSLANRDELRRRKLLIEEQGLETLFVWECEVDAMLDRDGVMSEYFETVRDSSIIVPREALFGGRTGPLSLKCDLREIENVPGGKEIAENFEILYYDIVSLYPAMNLRTEYPLGHPEVIVLDKPAKWTKPSDHAYRGLLKVFVIPPRDLYLPIIPQKIRGKLIFALCSACARRGSDAEEVEISLGKRKHRMRNPFCSEGGVLREPYTPELGQKLCTHGEEERGWVAVVTDIELNLALRYGYRVTHVYNIYHWVKWTSELFRPYVRQFMRLKVHASGWPEDVLCPEDPEREEVLKAEYIEKNMREYGIDVSPDEICLNPGLRYLAKLFLNSMWGRWSIRNNLAKDLITDNPSELHSVLNDPKLILGAVEMLNGKLAAIPYKRKRDFVKTGNRHNVMLAIVTTAAARATLYEYMDRVHRSLDSKLLYTDTDSVIFLHRRGTPLPFDSGYMLGQMSNEYPGHVITSFYSGGCKQHCLELVEITTGKESFVLKCRGCTLDSTNDDVFSAKRFKNMVNNFGMCSPLVMERQRFRPDFRAGKVLTRTVQISYRPVFDKAHIDAHLDAYPYGYIGDPVKFITASRMK